MELRSESESDESGLSEEEEEKEEDLMGKKILIVDD
jgi:hypothetical protein